MLNGIIVDEHTKPLLCSILKRHGWDKPICPCTARDLLRPVPGRSNIHHRQPRSQGGVLTLRNASLLEIKTEHVPWHVIFGSGDAAYTLAVEHAIQKQLGTNERTALLDISSLGRVYIPELEVRVSNRGIDTYQRLRAGRSHSQWLAYVNDKFNDPAYPWVELDKPMPRRGFSRIDTLAA